MERKSDVRDMIVQKNVRSVPKIRSIRRCRNKRTETTDGRQEEYLPQSPTGHQIANGATCIRSIYIGDVSVILNLQNQRLVFCEFRQPA